MGTQATAITSLREIDGVIRSLHEDASGGRVTFKANLSNHKPRDGQAAVVLSPVIYPSDGEGGYDEEALPFVRIRFADGHEMDAAPEEIVTDNEAIERFIAAVCVVFGHARDLGHAGPGQLEVEGTPEQEQRYLAKLRELPANRTQIVYES